MKPRSKSPFVLGVFLAVSVDILTGPMLFAAKPNPGPGAGGGSQCCIGSGGNAAGPSAPTEVIAFGDFNGDGFEDAAFGMPLFDVDGVARAGAVRVIYGSAIGLDDAKAQLWHKDLMPGAAAESEAQFGGSLAVGDFNGDETDDLAVGSPYEDLTSALNVGMVNVIFGEQGVGLTANGVWTLTGDSEADYFGFALAAGDFNRDSYSDLAVGAPGVDLLNNAGMTLSGAGSITVYDGASGFLPVQTLIAGLGNAVIGDGHGTTLAVGNFDCNPYDDLVAGQPNGAYENEDQTGNIYVRYGSSDWFDSAFFYQQDDLGGASESGDQFGASLAVGDFDHDGCDDLAVGSPGEDIVDARDAGVVNVIFGSQSGLTQASSQIWHQYDGRNRAEVPEAAEAGDRFGAALVAGNFDGDTGDDLAIGVPGEKVAGTIGAGLVHVLKGSLDRELEVWPEPTDRIWVHLQLGDPIRENDSFGTALGAGDINNDNLVDLAISAPVRAEPGESVAHMLWGTEHPYGPGWSRWQSWYEATDTLEEGWR